LRPAFTLIEILVSVLILSGSIVFVLKIHSQNHEQIIYITERNKHVLEDSLFLGQQAFRYHNMEKSAYDLISNETRIESDESRKILEKISRRIYIPEPLRLTAKEESEGPAATVNGIMLKSDFSSSYYDFTIDRF
jgi:prepilin-type N-terminal cleavage/methylation domain-containing protein